MTRGALAITIALAFAISVGPAWAESGFENFVTCSGDKLMAGERELRFVSFNIPNLHYVEDNMPFDQTNAWRLPDEFEITDALCSIRQMGGQVVRLYTLSVRKPDDNRAVPRHVLGPGKFNEDAFRALDKVLEVANRTGVRVIIPFVDNWVWWGGIKEYAGFRGKAKEKFWSDPEIIADFKKTIHYVINRTNTYTGVRYRDDTAIFGWETGNELQCPPRWTHEIAGYIKSVDKNHLVIDGFFTSVLRDESINDPLVDVVTTHHYPKNAQQMIEQVRANRERTKGKKPYFVGEFGFIETPDVRRFLDMVVDEGVCGALIWSLRYRSRDGGFYWHSEPFGGDKYKAYHWPGFASGDTYDERNLLKLVREKAFAIQRRRSPKPAAPNAPTLLPIADVSAISWQGSAGATSYTVERSKTPDGPWKVVGKDISDAELPYRPLFNDKSVDVGETYYYRVKARNSAGTSKASNIVGPVRAHQVTLVDEMIDYSLMQSHGGLSLDTKSTRKAKEDMNRVAGSRGSFLTYKLGAQGDFCRVFCFFPGEVSAMSFSASAGGETFAPISASSIHYYGGEGEYGYWKPVLYQSRAIPDKAKFLKVEFTTEAQISRVEIGYGGAKSLMDKRNIKKFEDSTRKELSENILGFWIKYCQDDEHGGFIGRMSNDRTIIPNAPKGLVLNARILWTYSAAYRFEKRDEYLQIAKRAYDYLMRYFWDREHGGAYWMLDYRGNPQDDSKEIYGQSFVVYALCEYYLTTGDSEALDKAKKLFRLIETNCHDAANKGYFETFSRDWSPADRARLATGDEAEKKTMNTHLHLLEAYTNLYRVWKDEKVKQRLAELIEVFATRIVNPQTRRFELFFDEKWNSTKEVISFGHDIEGSWLLCEAAEVLGDEHVIRRIRPLAVKMAEAAYEAGFDVDGGLFYEAEHDKITDDQKHWWPQAETVVGFLNAYQLSHEQRFLEAAMLNWEFIQAQIVDNKYGEWLGRSAGQGEPDPRTLKVSEWKAPYHNGRACLEVIRRLQEIQRQ
ncbi:MAG: AGE family epimerase/isomerase [Phycisphaerales bacterium]|nr:MAG: AGE family epimerase/isomerase [Phycisphaerales bacterium]